MTQPTIDEPHYVNLMPLAETSHGRSFRAQRASDGAQVVLKQRVGTDVAHQRQTLQREYNALQELDSPLVVKALQLTELEGKPTLVYEYAVGAGLGHAPLEFGELLHVAREVARALAHLHERGVAHNDLKPSNLIYDPATRALAVIDFDLATVAAGAQSQLAGAEGSLPYLAPERTGRMNRLPDYRADFYSLGITLFELASGRLPFEAADALGWAHAHLSKTAPALSDVNARVPAAFGHLVAKLLSKDPAQRYQSAYGLLADLDHCARAWAANGEIADFALGESDISQAFKVSRKLVGRNAELATCTQVLAGVANGPARALFVAGAAGVGKTSLLREFLRSCANQQATALYAAFEQHNQGRPYSALVAALEELISHALVQSEASLAELTKRLNETLGANTSVMAEFVPTVERILGPQKPPPVVNPNEAKHRLQAVVRTFLRAFSAPSRALVLALDDCQWLDVSTAELLTDLVQSGDVPYLLLVLGYRDGLPATHPLLELAAALDARESESPAQTPSLRPPAAASLRPQVAARLQRLTLSPLDRTAVATWLTDSLRVTSQPLDELAAVVHDKTDGNPFFVAELLETLASERVLTLDGAVGKWRWDLARARAHQVSANVADSVALKLARLGASVQRALGAAACLGLQFALADVAAASGLDKEAASAALWLAASERLIAPLAESEDGEAAFAFPHTRVLDAAYGALSAELKAELHRHIGANLLARHQADANAVQLFDVLHHQNLAQPSLTDSNELLTLVKLNLEGAARARRTAAFDVVRAYADFAMQAAARCTLSPELTFKVRFCQAEAAYLQGHFDEARELCDACFPTAETPLLHGQLHALKARIADHQGQLVAAIGELRAGLKALGVTLPEAFAEIDQAIGPGLGKMMGHLARLQVEDLATLPTVKNPETALILELLMQVVPPSIQTYPPLFIVAELMMFDLEMEHGVTAVSCKNFVDCGILQASMLGNHDTAYRLGQVAFKLLERFKPTPLEAAVNFVFAGFVSHWKAHFREAEAGYEKVKRTGVELGDVQHVAYTHAHHTQRAFHVGRPLGDCVRLVEEAVSFLSRGHHSGPMVGTTVAARAIARLCAGDGEEAIVATGDAEATATVLQSKNAQWGYSYGVGQMMVSVFLRDLPAARHWQAFTKPFSLAAASLFSVPDYHLFEALTDLWAASEDPSRLAEALSTSEAALAKLETWGKAAPENFSHKHELLRAERARAAGEPLHVVLDGYQRAISATGPDFPNFKALVSELEAELWLARGDARHAKPALEDAHRWYGVWGASAKLRQLERRHPWLKVAALRDEAKAQRSSGVTTTTTSSDLDAGSILKATQAISKEVQTDKLFAALMATLIESAGAQNGCLVLASDVDQQLYVEARADVDSPPAFGQPEALDGAPNVSAAVVRFVIRTREAVALDDAASAGPFQNDPHVKQQQVRSLLCVPIQRQGQVLGVLYLENNQTTHAFTRERVGILQVIASQAAISINNAQLYASLERRVKDRTAELAQKNRQIASMLDNMEQGVFTIDAALVIQPGYSRYLERVFGTNTIAGQECMQLLFQGADVRPDVLVAADGALRFSFGMEAWFAAVNAAHLVREFQRTSPSGQRQFLEVDWNFICDEQDVVERILVVVRDVTLLRQLQEAAAERGQEADIVTQLIETGVDAFHEFARIAHDFLEQNRRDLAAEETLSAERLTRSFRNLHTLKGNARLLGYTHLVDALHAAEERYAVLRTAGAEPVAPEVLRDALDRVEHALAHHQRICDGKLSKVTHTHDRRLEHVLKDISHIVQSAGSSANNNALADVARVLQRLDGVALADLVVETSRIVPSLAEELHKPTPVVACTGADLVLTKEWAGNVRDILVQCLRNTLFHGLEPEQERLAQGKSAVGNIVVEAQPAGSGFELRISDDGRGLALARLRESHQRANWNDERLAECIFESGVSTAQEVGLIAGRGVGLDIVRALLRSGGGDVHVRFTAAEQAGHRPFTLVLALPQAAVLAGTEPLASDKAVAAAE